MSRIEPRVLIIAAAISILAGTAFGEVDGWDRAKNIPYYTGDEPLEAFGADGEGAFGKHALLWSAGWGNADLSYIRVVYLDWGLLCETANQTIKTKPGHADALREEVELKRPAYKDKLHFYVTIAAGDVRVSRINNAACWTIYLHVGEAQVMPKSFEHIETADAISTRMMSYGGVLPTWHCAYVTKTYDVVFEYPFKETRPESLKLCIVSEYARRGFEWKFKKNGD